MHQAGPELRGNRWIRKHEEIAARIHIADHPDLISSSVLLVEPGTGVICYHADGMVALDKGIRCRIPEDATDLTLINMDPFKLHYLFPFGQLTVEVRFQVSEQPMEKFAQQLRILIEQRKQVFIKDIILLTRESIQRIFLASVDDFENKQKRIIQYFNRYGLNARVHEESSWGNSEHPRRLPCPDVEGVQDATIGYLIFSHDQEEYFNKPIPLIDGKYFIGRARSRDVLINRFGADHPQVIWFPKNPGPVTIVRVATISVEKGETRIESGWPASQGRERIRVKRAGMTDGWIELPKRCELKGFEQIHFTGDPQLKVLYIPPMAYYHGPPREESYAYLELMGLWASAAHGWEKMKNYERAFQDLQHALECSKRSGTVVEQGNILYTMLKIFGILGKDAVDFPYQEAAFNSLALPFFKVFIQDKILVQESPKRLGLITWNTSKNCMATNVSVLFTCSDLGVYHSATLGNLNPRQESKEYFWTKGINKRGKFPVEIVITFSTPEDNPYELSFSDFIEITPRPPRIKIAGDSAVVSVRVDDASVVPDINIGRDSGAVFVKLVRKD